MSFLNQPLTSILVQPKRQVGSIAMNVVISEASQDRLTITQQPVQQGAMIADHAFKEPVTLSMVATFPDNPFLSLSKVYQQFLDLQNGRIPFDVTTPKRIYRNMLLQVISQTTDKNTENSLALSLTFQEVIIVKVSTTTVPRSQQRNPGKTAETAPTGKKSALSVLVNALTGRP